MSQGKHTHTRTEGYKEKSPGEKGPFQMEHGAEGSWEQPACAKWKVTPRLPAATYMFVRLALVRLFPFSPEQVTPPQ